MTEERFVENEEGIYDCIEGKQYYLLAWDWVKCDDEKIVSSMNKQENLISALKKENKQLKAEKNILREQIHCGIKELCNDCDLVKIQDEQIRTLKKEKEAIEKDHKRQQNQIKLLNKQFSQIPKNVKKTWIDGYDY